MIDTHNLAETPAPAGAWEPPATKLAILSPEMADVIAHLLQQRDNALTMAARAGSPHADLARDRMRQLEVRIEDLLDGRHHGAAAVRAELLAGAAKREN